MRKNPPKLLHQFFRWYCNPRLLDYIEGDLLELYERRLKSSGRRTADFHFVLDVLMLFRPGIIGNKTSKQSTNALDMFLNNLKIASRSLWKNKLSTLVNILGLTTGVTACLLITLFIQHELSFDKFQSKGDRIARVIMEYQFEGNTNKEKGTFTSTKVAPVFSRTFPEVEKAVRMLRPSMIVQLNNEPVTESNFLFTDSSFFNVFDFEMIQGNPATALEGKKKVVLTEATAYKYFGDEDPLGKILEVGVNKTPFEVTGVIRNYPDNSQLQFDFLASFSSLGQNQERTYFNANYITYLLLRDANAFTSLEEKMALFMEKEMAGSGATIRYFLEPYKWIHLNSPYQALTANTSITFLYLLSGVAVLIITIVCFTYINLSIAKSIDRAKEVGIRKVSGAGRSQLFWQFIGEALVVCSLAMLVSFCAASIVLPYFNTFVDRSFQLTDLLSAPFLLVVFIITIVISLTAGGYPAMILSGFQPMRVLKGLFNYNTTAKKIQQSLVVFQFAITMLLIVSAIIIQNQVKFIQNKKLGYERNNVMMLNIGWKINRSQMLTLKEELKKYPQIKEVSRCANGPVNIISGYTMRNPSMEENDVISVNANPVDEDFIKATGLQLIAGRDFSEQDMQAVAPPEWEDKKFHFIINEIAAKILGWNPEEAIGREIVLEKEGLICGVVKDFHFQSMRSDLRPIVLYADIQGSNLLVKTLGNDISGTIAYIEDIWKKLLPERPFEYSFLDDTYNNMYKPEIQLGKVMNLFSGTAIFLACLGLFGLSSFILQQRMKEIGIRKVLGASRWSVMKLISSNFLKLVILAIMIGSPMAYLIMTNWLNEFAYHTNIQWWIFVIAGIAIIGITLFTVGIHIAKAMAENPVKSLRSE